MMAKKDIKDFVCEPFCSFYVEGAKEELICNGACVLEILMAKGMLFPEEITAMKRQPLPRDFQNPALEEGVCGKCVFRADDCDFLSVNPPPNTAPCGGYILLTLLTANDLVSPEGLAEIADG
jgi:hypothetical protein